MQGVATCVIALALVVGCAKQPSLTQASAPAPAGAPTVSGIPGSGGTVTGGPASRTIASRPSTSSRSVGTASTSTPRPKPAEYIEAPALEDIHFDFDRYELRDDDRLILERHAAWLKERAGTLLLVEGHCDERGTPEYNISLGERRAKATANYLTSRGVASDRITVISYGEQHPVCREQGEACWSRNRRAHFLVKER